DEIQCGMGRTGRPFYFDAIGLKPQVVSLGKALGGGVTVGAALLASAIGTPITYGAHGTTYGGNLLACRAAMCVLDELVDGCLLAHVAEVGQTLERTLHQSAHRRP